MVAIQVFGIDFSVAVQVYIGTFYRFTGYMKQSFIQAASNIGIDGSKQFLFLHQRLDEP